MNLNKAILEACKESINQESDQSLKDIPVIADILYKATVRWFDELADADREEWINDREENSDWGDDESWAWPCQTELDFFAGNFKDNSEKLSKAKTVEDLAKLVKNIVLSIKDASENVEYKDSGNTAFKFAKESDGDPGYGAIAELAGVDPKHMLSILKKKQEELENGELTLHLA